MAEQDSNEQSPQFAMVVKDEQGNPCDEMTADLARHLREAGLPVTVQQVPVSEVATPPLTREQLQEHIARTAGVKGGRRKRR